jgi:hypothetical protein
MGSAVAIDGRRGPALPSQFRIPQRLPEPDKRESPIPEDWTEGADFLRDVADFIDGLSKGK